MPQKSDPTRRKSNAVNVGGGVMVKHNASISNKAAFELLLILGPAITLLLITHNCMAALQVGFMICCAKFLYNILKYPVKPLVSSEQSSNVINVGGGVMKKIHKDRQ